MREADRSFMSDLSDDTTGELNQVNLGGMFQ